MGKRKGLRKAKGTKEGKNYHGCMTSPRTKILSVRWRVIVGWGYVYHLLDGNAFNADLRDLGMDSGGIEYGLIYHVVTEGNMWNIRIWNVELPSPPNLCCLCSWSLHSFHLQALEGKSRNRREGIFVRFHSKEEEYHAPVCGEITRASLGKEERASEAVVMCG